MGDVRTVRQALLGVVRESTVRLALNTHANLVRSPAEGGTPVDTNWARSHWLVSGGSPRDEPAPRPRDYRGGPASAAQSSIAQFLASYRLAQGSAFVANGAPYIQRLNEGHSQQAPAGFVQRGIREAVMQTADEVRALVVRTGGRR